MNNVDFKDKVKALRLGLNMTMDELSKKVNVSTPTIQRYESGEIKNVRRDKIQLLASALETTPAYLMGWDENSSVDLLTSSNDSDIRRIQRARNKMPEKDREKMMKLLEVSFEDYFGEDYLDEDDN